MAVCIACGTDNRDKALFCRGCATSMVAMAGSTASAAPVADTAPKGPTQTCPACQAKNPLVATSCKTCGASLVPDMVAPTPTPKAVPASIAPSSSNAKLVVMVTLVLIISAVGAWWWSAQDATSAQVSLVVPAVAQTSGLGTHFSTSSEAALKDKVADPDAASVAAAEAQGARIKQQADGVASADRARLIRERREKQARELAATERRRAAQAREQQQAEQARRRAEETARQKAVEAAALAAAQPARPVQTVDMICATSSNFIAREVCRTRECRSPAFTNDPVCVRFREVEAANLRKPMF